MNIRQRYILKTLISEKSINIAICAKECKVGERTIRYDIDIISDYIRNKLQKDGLSLKKNVVFFLLDKEEAKILELDETVNDYYTTKISSEERVVMILCDLCWANKRMTIQQLVDKYFVSRGTINSDLIEVKKWCSERNIPFISQKGKGIYINATEKERRGYITEIIRFSSNLEYSQSFIFTEWFKDIDVEKIKLIVMQAEKKFGIWLTDIAFEGLSIHIALSVKRNQKAEKKPELINARYDTIDPQLYEMAKEIVKNVSEAFALQFPESEISYVAIHLGGKSSYLNDVNIDQNALIEYYAINMINHVSNILRVDLKQDKRLLEGLIQHLRACHYRYRNDMVMQNPLKQDLIDSYPKLYNVLVLFIENNEEQGLIKNNEDEITYILLHFAAAINRKSNKSKEIPNILVVCSTGIGTSELLVSSLNKYFKFKIQASIALHQLNYYLGKYPIDLIITTVPLETVIPHVRVNPILTNEDIYNIREILSKLGFEILSAENSLLMELTKVIEKYEVHGSDPLFIKELMEIYNRARENENVNKNKMEGYKMLSELLTKETINLESECKNWQEAISASGKLLVKKECITDAYIKASIDSVKENGPYIVITKGVALAHASNVAGVLKTGMALARLKEPVVFGNKNNDPVRFVFMLATMDSTLHLVALSDLAEFLERKEFMELLDQAIKKEQILTYIHENETKLKGV